MWRIEWQFMKQIHSRRVISPIPGKEKSVQVKFRSSVSINFLISSRVFLNLLMNFSFNFGSGEGRIKSGDRNFVLKSRKLSRITSSWAFGSRSFVILVFPFICRTAFDSDLKRCSATCPAVQLPSKGTALNCSCRNEEIVFNRSVVDSSNSAIIFLSILQFNYHFFAGS